MRVLYITGIPAPYRVALFNEMGKLMDLTVAFLGKSQAIREKEWQSEQAANFEAIFLNETELKNSVDFSAVKYLKENYKKFDRIVLHGYSSFAAMAAIRYLKKKRIPFLLEADGGIIRKEPVIKKCIKTKLISAASGWLSSGKMTTDFFAHYGAAFEKIYAYPFTSIAQKDILNEIVSSDKKVQLRHELNISEEKAVLSVGQMIHRKGFDVLIKAFHIGMPADTGLYIIGGEPTEEIKNLAGENPHIHFLSFMPKDKLKKYYQAADVYAFSTREDIWGLVVNEALANGLPVISTDQSVAAMEMLPPWCIVPAENPKALYDKCTELLKDDQKRRNLAEQALDTSRKYTIEKSAQKHWEIMKYDL